MGAVVCLGHVTGTAVRALGRGGGGDSVAMVTLVKKSLDRLGKQVSVLEKEEENEMRMKSAVLLDIWVRMKFSQFCGVISRKNYTIKIFLPCVYNQWFVKKMEKNYAAKTH